MYQMSANVALSCFYVTLMNNVQSLRLRSASGEIKGTSSTGGEKKMDSYISSQKGLSFPSRHKE